MSAVKESGAKVLCFASTVQIATRISTIGDLQLSLLKQLEEGSIDDRDQLYNLMENHNVYG